MGQIEITDRYTALGIPLPDPKTMCKGQCEGTGVVPIHEEHPNDEEGEWHDLWLKAEADESTTDGYHFVTCPACNGTRLNKETPDEGPAT